MTWKINISEWRVHEFITWQKAMKELDVITINEYLARAIESWDFSDDPHVEENYKWLTFSQWSECIVRVNHEIRNLIERAIQGVENP